MPYNYKNPHPLTKFLLYPVLLKMSSVVLFPLREFHWITIESKIIGEQCGLWASFSPTPCSKKTQQNYYFAP